MSAAWSKLRSLAAVVAMVVTLEGCLFGGVTVSSFEGIVSMSVGGVDVGTCFEDQPAGTFRCFPDTIFSSDFQTLSLPQLLLRLVLLDPLVVQFPAGVTNFAGSFAHTGSGMSGPLAIQAGLTSVRIDLTRTLVAEPGTQLVVIALPPNAPTTGQFAFNLNFRVPPGTTTLPVKPIITGLVQLTDGSTFHPPIWPCAQSMAAAPLVTIPLPAPGDAFTFPQPPNLGCRNVVYDYVGAEAAAPAADIPATGPWMLAALIALLGSAGALRLGRRQR
jgi:hypothetical protein